MKKTGNHEFQSHPMEGKKMQKAENHENRLTWQQWDEQSKGNPIKLTVEQWSELQQRHQLEVDRQACHQPNLVAHDRGSAMNTTFNITVEKIDGGHRVKINHEGAQLDHNAKQETIAAIQDYWDALEVHANSQESLNIMKTRRNDMKRRIKDHSELIERFEGEGRFIEGPEEGDDGLPF